MAFLADTWMLWLVLAAVVGGIMVFYRESRRNETMKSGAPTQEDFSVRTILLGVRRGEGDLFLGYLAVILFFSMFLAGLVHWLRVSFF